MVSRGTTSLNILSSLLEFHVALNTRNIRSPKHSLPSPHVSHPRINGLPLWCKILYWYPISKSSFAGFPQINMESLSQGCVHFNEFLRNNETAINSYRTIYRYLVKPPPIDEARKIRVRLTWMNSKIYYLRALFCFHRWDFVCVKFVFHIIQDCWPVYHVSTLVAMANPPICSHMLTSMQTIFYVIIPCVM